MPDDTPHAAAAAHHPGTHAAVTVSTPGKLILMGEHAVVYGRPALIAAIDLRLRAHVSAPAAGADADPDPEEQAEAAAAAPSAGGTPPRRRQQIDIDLPGLAHRAAATWEDILGYTQRVRDGWAAYAAQPAVAGFLALRGDDPAHIVKVALGEVAAAIGEDAATAPDVFLRIESDLPIGSGFGSSAAIAVAVVAGYALWRRGGHKALGVGPDRAGEPFGLDLDTIEHLALEAERRQHGLPSGVDTATSLRGGLLWAQRLPSGELAWESLASTSPLLRRLRVFHTGMPPEPTGAVVAAVRAARDRDPGTYERLFDRMAAAAAGLRAELDAAAGERPDTVISLIADHQACLEALGVVPPPVAALVRQVEAAGGAAKVSGAGSLAGPGAGSLLVYHPTPERMADWAFLRHLPHHPVHLGAAGLRREIP